VFEIHDDLDRAIEALGPRRWLALTTRGATRYDRVEYRRDDVLLFGPETRGLPEDVLARFAAGDRVKIPQRDEGRSLNLSNAAAVVFYEAWRQLGFE
jgi:tRNA (cytidine/uridine-2'-O-)-methyltransferase